MEPSGEAIAQQRAEHFLDVPVNEIRYSPMHRSLAMAQAIQGYTGAPIVPSMRLMSWNMGDLQGQNLADVQDEIRRYMLDKPRDVIPGGESYMQFLARVIPYIKDACGSDELVCVTHFRPILAIAAWDAAGRDGLSQDKSVLENAGNYDNHQIVLMTPDSFIPLVKDEIASGS